MFVLIRYSVAGMYSRVFTVGGGGGGRTSTCMRLDTGN